MNLSGVQAAVAAKIAADATLSPYGAAVVLSWFTDVDTLKTTIETAIESKGVCFGVGLVQANASDDRDGRWVSLTASVNLYVEEGIKVTHALTGLALVEKVIAAVIKDSGSGESCFSCGGYDAADNDHGNVLHVIRFTVPIDIASP